ncbi:MAG: lamin tail domain-containing protein [Verrucomicrobiota bacterium]|nr:lamin tail domain-containing protein [Verrucomicrobiota bacterium]
MKKNLSLLSLLILLGVTNEAFCLSLSGDAAKVERPGPSNRRSPFIISEIMYHPAPQESGVNLEFIEIFNSQPWWEEVGGFRIDGDINYSLPPGTRIEKLNYLIIASDPEAVKKAYGLQKVLGPYTGRLSNGGGRLRMRNNLDAVLFEVNYNTRAPWPSSSDGAGHSLTLARPSYGEKDARAWAQSDAIGGSPGKADTPGNEPLRLVCINEIKTNAEGNTPAFVELYNHSATEADLSGTVLTDSIGDEKFIFKEGIIIGAGEQLTVSSEQLGFPLVDGKGVVWFLNGTNTRVLDAIHYKAQPNGFSLGRSRDGDAQWDHFAKPTFGQANQSPFQHDIVINEIMYNPISLDSDDEYIELHNRGNKTVELSNWQFKDGIDFRFLDGTRLAAGGYLVVAKNRAQLLAKQKDLDPNLVYGDYGGTLSNRGERLLLTMPKEVLSDSKPGTLKSVRVPVDEVTYGDGGTWGNWSDANGSSLELRDPHSDNRQASNWADSDESGKSDWVTISGEGSPDKTRSHLFSANYLQMFLLDQGECLVDDVQVFDARTNAKRVQDPGFEKKSTLELVGTHDQSEIIAGKGHDGSKALHLKASSRGDTEGNGIWLSLSGRNPTKMRIEAKARWLRGHPELLMRTRNGGYEAFGSLTVPTNLGTPTLPNSIQVENVGPVITGVTHSPVYPKKNQSAIVSARITDPDGLSKVTLQYRIDPSKTTTEIEMTDNGTAQDQVANDGIFTGQLPAQTMAKLVCFRIVAKDALEKAKTSSYPSTATARECLIRMGTNPAKLNELGQYHFLINRDASLQWSKNHKRSNAALPVTMVYNGERVIYDAGMYYGAGSYHSRVYSGPTGALSDYNATFPSDNRFMGAKKIVLSMPGAPSDRVPEPTAQIEQAAFWLMYKAGITTIHRRYVNLYVNGRKRAKVYEDTQRPNRDLVRQWYPTAGGELYKIQMWKELTNPKRGQNYQYESHPAFLGGNQDKNGIQPWYYRLSWSPRAYDGSANQMANLFELVKRINDTKNPEYIQRLEKVANMEQWMRVFAVENIICNWDSYGASNGQNMSTFKPSKGRFEMIPWDIDLGLGKGSFGSNNQLFSTSNPYFWSLTGDPIIKKIYRVNHFKRHYLRAVLELLDGPMNGDAFKEYVDKKYNALKANKQTVNRPTSLTSFIKGRSSYLQRTIDRLDNEFSVTQLNDIQTDELTVTLSGSAPLRMRSLQVNGVPQQPEWKKLTRWELKLPVEATQKNYTITAIGGDGKPILDASQSVEVHYTGDEPFPHESVHINEWMASNDTTHMDTADNDFDDWIELHNRSELPVDLSGWWLTDDKTSPRKWQFPEGATIPAKGYLLIWADDEPLQTGDEFHVPFKLTANGESILLFDPEGRLADEVIFGQQKPDVAMGRSDDKGVPTAMAKATPGAKNESVSTGPTKPIQLALASDKPFTFTFHGEDGLNYIIEQSTDLRSWREVQTTNGKDTLIRHTIPPGQAEIATFFRVSVEN